MSIGRHFLFVLLSIAVSLAVSARTSLSGTLYALTMTSSSTDNWVNESRAAGIPTANCSGGSFSYNSTVGSGNYLEVSSWDPFSVPAGQRIAKVEVDVHGGYEPNTSTLATIRLRVRGTVLQTLNDSQTWTQSGDNCSWRMGGSGWDITYLKPAGWTAADIAGLIVGARRINPPSTCRVDGFLVTVTTESCLPAVPSPSTSSPVCGTVRISWPAATMNTSSYTVYRYGTPIASGLTGNSYDDTVPAGQTNSYTVQAFGPCGASGQSVAVNGTANGPVPAPTGLYISAHGCGVVRLVWNASALGNKYHVYRDGIALGTTASTIFDDENAGTADHCYQVSAEHATFAIDCSEGSPSSQVCGNGRFATEVRQRRLREAAAEAVGGRR